jgi:hypothetical protein
MAWPTTDQYRDAIEDPTNTLADPELRSGQPAMSTVLVGPLTFTGGAASVFKMVAGKRAWAVKCFIRQFRDLQERYRLLSDHIDASQRKFMVGFRFLDQGIKIDGQWFPLVKMDWVEGLMLNLFVAEHVGSPEILKKICTLWLRLERELLEANMAHGDLQHGNVLLVPAEKSGSLYLRLIDYDGMWVPALEGKPPSEYGHANYQHPQRMPQHWSRTIDRFSQLLIYTALRGLVVGGRSLWQQFDNSENLLFSRADLDNPAHSKLFAALMALPDPEVHLLAAHLADAAMRPLEQVPALSEVVREGRVQPLSLARLTQLAQIWPVLRPEVAAAAGNGGWLRNAANAPQTTEGPAKRTRILDVLEVVEPEALGSVRTLEAAPRANKTRAKPETGTRFAPDTLEEVLSAEEQNSPQWQRRLLIWASVGVVVMLLLVGSIAALAIGPRKPPAVVTRPNIEPPPPQITHVGALDVRARAACQPVIHFIRPDVRQGLRIALEELPHGVSCAPVDVPANVEMDQIHLHISTQATAPIGPHLVSVVLYEGTRRVDERKRALNISHISEPSIRSVSPSTLVLKPGRPGRLIVVINRNGSSDLRSLRLAPLPASVTVLPIVNGLAEDEMGLELTADNDAPLFEAQTCEIFLMVNGKTIETKPVTLSIDSPIVEGLKLKVPMKLGVIQGEIANLDVQLERGTYRGEVTLRIRNLPEGLGCPEAVLMSGVAREVLRIDSKTFAFAFGGTGQTVTLDVEALINEQVVANSQVQLQITAKPVAMKKPESALPAAKAVKIETGDGLPLNATLYPTDRGNNKATVLLLRDVKPLNAKQNDAYASLAKSLQKLGCAVLTFDYRGVGENDGLVPNFAFWTHPSGTRLARMQGVRLGDFLTKIRGDKMLQMPGYLPYLAQDLVAARHWIQQTDSRVLQPFFLQDDDLGELNPSNLIIIGVGEGAQVASIWLASEHRRYPIGTVDYVPEGRDILACCWIGYPEATRITVNRQVTDILAAPAKTLDPTPIALLYDQNDTVSSAGAKIAERVFRKSLAAPGGMKPIDGPKVFGAKLLEEQKTKEAVVEFVKAVLAKPLHPRRSLPTNKTFWRLKPKGLDIQVNNGFPFGPGLAPLVDLGYPEPK